MITLYHFSDCPFCWKVRLALYECKAPYKSVVVSWGEKHPEVVRLSPKGTVPLLVDDDLVLSESPITVEYIDEKFGQGKLLPEDPAARARLRSLQAYSDTALNEAMLGLMLEKWGKPEKDWNLEIIAEGVQRWKACLDTLEGLSSRLDPHHFSIADCALLPRFALADRFGLSVDKDHPKLLAWFTAAREHPAFQNTRPESQHNGQVDPA